MPVSLGPAPLSDIRIDPVSRASQGVDIGNRGPTYSGGNYYDPELHTVTDFDNYGRIGIQLLGLPAPGIDPLSSVALFYADSGDDYGEQLTEVVGEPGTNQFRVIRPDTEFQYNLGFGFAELNQGDLSKDIEAHYKFIGSCLTVSQIVSLQAQIDAITVLDTPPIKRVSSTVSPAGSSGINRFVGTADGLTDNYITIPGDGGQYVITGQIDFNNFATTVGWTLGGCRWCSAAAAGGSVEPPNMQAYLDSDARSGGLYYSQDVGAATSVRATPAPTIFLRRTASLDLYLVPHITTTSNQSDGLITVRITAQRLS